MKEWMDVAVRDAADALNKNCLYRSIKVDFKGSSQRQSKADFGKGKFMNVNTIEGEMCKTTRPLWEEVFTEDSVQFTDYYFDNKAEKNIGYVIGQFPYDAMMFRTPYKLQIGKKQKEISYIVGVATREECRHRGYMRELLMHAFREMYKEKNSFTFLMPANPAIYEPFDFAYIYEREVWELKEPEKTVLMLEGLDFRKTKEEMIADSFHGLYSVRNVRRQFPEFPIMHLLAKFANQYLQAHYNIYVSRDVSYYEMQLKELEAQNGDIYVLFENEEIKAFFLYAKEGEEIFIQEVMEEQEGTLYFIQKNSKKKPIIMARIICLEEMMKLVCSKENRTLVVEIEDELITENAGVYLWNMTPNGSQVTKVKSKVKHRKHIVSEMKAAEKSVGLPEEKADRETEISMNIKEFTEWILTGVFINEIV